MWSYDEEAERHRRRQNLTEENRTKMATDWFHKRFPATQGKQFMVYFTDCLDLEDSGDNQTMYSLNKIATIATSKGGFDCNKISAIVCEDYEAKFEEIHLLYQDYRGSLTGNHQRKLEHAFRRGYDQEDVVESNGH